MAMRFDEFYVRSLRLAYDAERQLAEALPRLAKLDPVAPCALALTRLAREASEQTRRLEAVFRALYQAPRADPSWPVTALLREAEEYAVAGAGDFACSGIATALLAIKRLQITRYEALMAWSLECGLEEAVPTLRRALAEALVAGEALGTIAFGVPKTWRAPAPANGETSEAL